MVSFEKWERKTTEEIKLKRCGNVSIRKKKQKKNAVRNDPWVARGCVTGF